MGRCINVPATVWFIAIWAMYTAAPWNCACLRADETLPAEPAEEFVATDDGGSTPRVEKRATKARPPKTVKTAPGAVQQIPSRRPSSRRPAAPPIPTADEATKEPTGDDTGATAEPAESITPSAAEAGEAEVAVQSNDENGTTRKKLQIDPASFKGVHPGRTTVEELEREWGKPKQIKQGEDGQAEHIYKIDPFDRVNLTIAENVVNSLLIQLDKPLPPETVAEQLQMDDVKAVTVFDARGEALGQAFPERGVLFTYAADTDGPAVSQIVLEPIDPQTFVLRAEQHVADAYLASLEDVDYAISLNVRNARAHFVRAQLMLEMGNLEAALKAAEQSVSIEPDTAEFRLLLSRILMRLADFAGATQQLEDVLAIKKLAPLHKARAEFELGNCAAHLAAPDYPRALEHHQAAIALCEPLVADERTHLRRAAKELLISAHLAIATDIAAGRWQHKDKVVPKWLDRASAFAEEMISHEQGSSELRLRVSEGALSALALLPEPPDAQTWIDTLLHVGKDQVDAAADTAIRQSCQWRLGIALSDAMQIEQARGEHASAIDYGKLALEMFKQSGKAGAQWPAHDYLLGRVYYRMGNIEAIDRENHKKAIAWYDKAVSLLESPLPPSSLTDAGRQGESFISMAVSYWEAGGRDEALRLTRQGVQLMEKAAEENLVNRASLAIPYGNLASMHEELGHAKEARKYADLAQKCERTEKK